jgi:hypothetical protein
MATQQASIPDLCIVNRPDVGRSLLGLWYRRTDKSRPVSFTVSSWEWIYATNLSRLQRETSKRYVAEAHSVLAAAILFPQHLSCYWGKIVSLRMLADLRLTIAQQRTTGQNLPSDLYVRSEWRSICFRLHQDGTSLSLLFTRNIIGNSLLNGLFHSPVANNYRNIME